MLDNHTPTLPTEILNENLQPSDIPSPDVDWRKIIEFGLTFNGYARPGSVKACADIAQVGHPETLTELRTCLFYRVRQYHLEDDPNGQVVVDIWSLIETIREHVEADTTCRIARMNLLHPKATLAADRIHPSSERNLA